MITSAPALYKNNFNNNVVRKDYIYGTRARNDRPGIGFERDTPIGATVVMRTTLVGLRKQTIRQAPTSSIGQTM